MLIDKIQANLKDALLARDEAKVSTLRMIISSVNNAKIESRTDLTDDEVVALIAKQAKQAEESLTTAKNAHRAELVEQAFKEKEILSTYLPTQMDQTELEKIVNEIIAETGATSISEMGKVMSIVMSKIKGQADGTTVSNLVQAKLTS
jgi:uncharacterized protein YqeY